MAKVSLTIDKRPNKNGQCAVRICIRNANSTSYIPTGYYCTQQAWNEKNPISSLNRAEGMVVEKMFHDVSSIVLTVCPAFSKMHANDIRTKVVDVLWPEEKEVNKKTFMNWFKHYVTLKTRPKTIESFKYTIDQIYRFDKTADQLAFEDITKDWLTMFQNWCLKSLKINSTAIHLENIRAVMNDAIDNDLTENYPFRKFKIKRERVDKRAIPIEKLRELFKFRGDDTQNFYLDVFKLMFYLCGINMKDLFELKTTDVYNGRIEYKRSKTMHHFTIKIEPEAQELLDKLKGQKNDNLVCIADRYVDYNHFLSRMNKNLKRIGTYDRVGLGGKKVNWNIIVPRLSTYYARHSWATTAASLDIPIETISQALGHEFGLDTTNRYVTFDTKKIDDANRRVIDYVLYEEG